MDDLEVKYYTASHPGSYAGPDKIYRSQTEASRKQVRKWLSGEDAYTLHKPIRYHFPRNRVVVSTMDSQWDIDLASMVNYTKSNDGYSYFLLAVDILSHYVWTRALKTKKAEEVAKAIESIFAEGRTPDAIRSDPGGEFIGKVFKRTMDKAGVHHFVTHNEVKANYAERSIRTIRLRISRFFTRKQTNRWIDVLPEITKSYNNTYHRTIKRKPASVSKENASEVWEIQYGGPGFKPDGAFKLELGDPVRISHLRGAFQREYSERWTGEIFKVRARRVRGGLNIYELDDWLGQTISGTFYEPELQKITADPTGIFKIDKILRKRKRKGHEPEVLVHWLNWPDKYNSWVKASDMLPV